MHLSCPSGDRSKLGSSALLRSIRPIGGRRRGLHSIRSRIRVRSNRLIGMRVQVAAFE